MPTALPLTDDLLDLARSARDADRAMETATRAGEDVEPARQDYLAVAAAIYAHPTLAEARGQGCHAQTMQALKDAVRED